MIVTSSSDKSDKRSVVTELETDKMSTTESQETLNNDIIIPYYNTKSILEEKRSRKRVENDRMRLINRVRQLEKEEEKLNKRIVETKNKTQNVLESKRRNERSTRMKEERFKREQQQINKQKEGNWKLKNEIKKGKAETECKILESKVSLVKRTKEEKQEIEKRLQEERLVARRIAMKKKEAVQKIEKGIRVKIEKYKSDMIHMAQQNYESRLNSEIRNREEKEKELLNLVQLESEIIKRLGVKQREQDEANEILDEALSIKISQNNDELDLNIKNKKIECKNLFDKYDQNKKGYVEISNLKSILNEMGIKLTIDEIHWMKIRQEIDPKMTGKMTFDQLFNYIEYLI